MSLTTAKHQSVPLKPKAPIPPAEILNPEPVKKGGEKGAQVVRAPKLMSLRDDDQPRLGILILFEVVIWGSVLLVAYVLVRGILSAMGLDS